MFQVNIFNLTILTDQPYYLLGLFIKISVPFPELAKACVITLLGKSKLFSAANYKSLESFDQIATIVRVGNNGIQLVISELI